MTLLSIQYLRGLAALFIVFYHVYIQLSRLGYSGSQPQFLNGGVDIFFVISGFIMWYTTFNKNVGALEFFKHRLIRIVPLYWIVTTFYLSVLLVRPSSMQSAQFDFYHVIASYLFIPAVHPVASRFMWPLVVPGWTLNYEMLFYLLFGLALIFKGGARAALVVAALVCLVGLGMFGFPQDSIFGFYSSSIVLEFAFGVALGYLFTKGTSIPRVPSIVIIVVGFSALATCSNFGLPDSQRVLTLGIPAFLIVAGSIFYERAHKIQVLRFPKLLGDASYSLYLSHGATLSALSQIWRYLGFPSTLQPLSLILFSLTGIAVAIFVGINLYYFVERPILSVLTTRFNKTNPKSIHRLPVR